MKILSLISGEFDSPVASYLMIKQGHEVEFVHFDSQPFNNEMPVVKTKKSILALKKYVLSRKPKKITLLVVPHDKIIAEFMKKCNLKDIYILWRRAMMRCAGKIAKGRMDAIMTGDSLGQVASQTLDNMYTINKSVPIPIIRPLVGMNKTDIIKLSKIIGTHDIAILPSVCCSVSPKHPTTHSNLKLIEAEEAKINIDELEDESLSRKEIILL
ncbi:MAG: 7-cyano-7-deazaguanine synthase [Candidatus Aenigmarchaeota archaeon]|nr:7-cyano-7-deazaguanine synthase [Candidatus Aenigmarchaeota archaeon]